MNRSLQFRPYARPVVALLCALAAYGFFPARAYATGVATTSENGVTVNQQSSGTLFSSEFSHGGETMTVVADAGGHLYDWVTVDGQLTFEFWWRYNSDGEKVLDRSTVSYAGQSVSRDGTQTTVFDRSAETPDGETTEEERLHPNLEAQLSLVYSAMNSLHSPQFLQAVTDTRNGEIGTNGVFGCVLSIVEYIVSWIAIASCVAVWPCVGAIALHIHAVASMMCDCAADC